VPSPQLIGHRRERFGDLAAVRWIKRIQRVNQIRIGNADSQAVERECLPLVDDEIAGARERGSTLSTCTTNEAAPTPPLSSCTVTVTV